MTSYNDEKIIIIEIFCIFFNICSNFFFVADCYPSKNYYFQTLYELVVWQDGDDEDDSDTDTEESSDNKVGGNLALHNLCQSLVWFYL